MFIKALTQHRTAALGDRRQCGGAPTPTGGVEGIRGLALQPRLPHSSLRTKPHQQGQGKAEDWIFLFDLGPALPGPAGSGER